MLRKLITVTISQMTARQHRLLTTMIASQLILMTARLQKTQIQQKIVSRQLLMIHRKQLQRIMILTKVQLLKSKAADINGIAAGSVTIGTYFSIATHWLPDIIRDFSAAYPGISIQIREGGHQLQMQWLKEGAIDFAMCSFDKASSCRWIHLQEDPMVIVVPAAHPFASRRSLSLQECCEEPFVMPAFGDDYDVNQAVLDSGIRLNIKYSTVENYSAIAMVESGLGISVMNRLITKGLDRQIVCVPMDPPVSVPLGILMPPDALSPAADKMVSFLQQKLKI